MQLDQLYSHLLKQGVRANEAAALAGYAVLVRQVGWEGFHISHAHRRKIQRSFIRLGVVPHDIQCGESIHQSAEYKKLIAEGILLSGESF